MYIAHPTHGAGTRPNRTQPPTAARKTTLNAGQCVRQPREGRGRNRQAPPPQRKKTGGGGGGARKQPTATKPPANTTRGGQTPHPEGTEDRTPKRGTGGPPSQNRQHQARNSGTPGKGTPKHADTHHQKKKPAAQPERKGMGGQGPQGPGQRHPATDTTKPNQEEEKKWEKHTPTTQPGRAGHSQDPGPARTLTPHTGTGNGGGQAERARNHTRPISRPKPKPNHEHHKQPAEEGQHHKPCPSTPTQDPSQDWRG